jgi:glutathione synthase
VSKKAALKMLWVTDPWHTLDHPKDTSLRLMEEARLLQNEGTPIRTFWCDVKSVRIEEGRVVCTAHELERVHAGRSSQAFDWRTITSREPTFFDRIVYRTDPPVDHAYLHPLQMLHLGAANSKRTQIINPATPLALGNEKFEATQLKSFTPPCVVSSSINSLVKFGKVEGETVLKPLFQAQSKGVELLQWKTAAQLDRSREILKLATHQETQPVILQRYLPSIQNGEQRLWFLDGRLLACVRKVPKKGSFRIDMDRGGTLEKTTLNVKEKRAARAIGGLLAKQRIRLAAVDLIEGLVTDFNHTSPGLLTPMEALLERNLAREVIQALIKPWSGARAASSLAGIVYQ